MLGEDFLAHFLLTLMDIRIELVPVFSYRELLVVINGDEYLFCADRFFIGIMKLGYKWML